MADDEVITPSRRLMLADQLRRRRGPLPAGPAASHGSPLAGLSESVGSVLHGAGYGRRPAPADRAEGLSDADAPTQAVVDEGDQMVHKNASSDGAVSSMPVWAKHVYGDAEGQYRDFSN